MKPEPAAVSLALHKDRKQLAWIRPKAKKKKIHPTALKLINMLHLVS